MDSFFTFLYPLVTIMALMAFLPQINALIKAKSPPENVSLTSWLIWSLCAAITFGYAFFHVHDTLLSLSAAISLALNLSVAGLIVYNRHVRFARPLVTPPVAIRVRIADE